MNQQNKLRKEFMETYPPSYIALEKTGHIAKGAISDNVNWKEIADFYEARTIPLSSLTAWIEEKRDFFKKGTGGTTDASLYAKAVVVCLDDLSTFIEGKK